MRIPLSASIAWRYLTSKKSHGAVGTITTVSAVAVAVATAAMVCVLSVFNGFRQVIGERLDTLSPEIMITPAEGKVLGAPERVLERVRKFPGVEAATPTLADNALVIAGSSEMPVKLKGVEAADYSRITGVRQAVADGYGTFMTGSPDSHEATPSIGVAARLELQPGDRILVFTPRREGRVNVANPEASFITDSLETTGIYRTDQTEYDREGLIVTLEMARKLLDRPGGASAIEIKTEGGTEARQIAETLSAALGVDYVVKDRLAQQAANFRMVNIEKWISFLLLGFILAIASFNLVSSICMLVIEKQGSLGTLRALGLPQSTTGAVFAWESMYVALAGGIGGILAGVLLCLLQQHYGLLRFGGEAGATIVSAYPVKLMGGDIAATLLCVLLIGAATSGVTAMFARRRSTAA